jgi:ABC-2 type transport system ATP-binding protein
LTPSLPSCSPAIELAGLTKRFGDVVAVDDLSFTVPRGTVTGFLGANGAGKTTTLRMLLALVTSTAGTAKILGQPYWALSDPLRRVGAVLEASSFHPGRTARNHLRVCAVAGGIDPKRIDTVLEIVGLTRAADRRVGGFSLGMRQRLGLAAALLGDPEVLVLDEPATGLDPEGVRWLRELLRGFADGGRSVLVSSHILAEVAQTVDRVVIIDRGRLVVDAPLHELTTAGGIASVVRVRTPMAVQLSAAVADDGARAVVTAPDLVEISGSTPERVGILAAQRAIPVFESTIEAPDLEAVFFQLTAGADAGSAP